MESHDGDHFLLASLVVAASVLFPASAEAQSLQNINATFQNGKVLIYYDLTGGNSSQKFALDLYGSHNNYSAPLTRVTGDVGQGIIPGRGKKIEWDAAADLGKYNGQITFKIKGEAMIMPFVFKNPSTGTVRRGKDVSVQWEGGRMDQTVQLELYKDGQRVKSVAETKNNGQYVWHLPSDMEKGSYFLKLHAGQETAQSKAFDVKARTPLIVKALPIAVIAGVVVALSGGGDDDGDPVTGGSDLPAAPSPE